MNVFEDGGGAEGDAREHLAGPGAEAQALDGLSALPFNFEIIAFLACTCESASNQFRRCVLLRSAVTRGF
jgi:hypothetical protein